MPKQEVLFRKSLTGDRGALRPAANIRTAFQLDIVDIHLSEAVCHIVSAFIRISAPVNHLVLCFDLARFYADVAADPG